MDLSFGTNVVEHGYRIGRCAAIEADRLNHSVRTIVISERGTMDTRAERRPLAAIPVNHFDGDIVLRAVPGDGPKLAPADVLVLTGATRVMRGTRQIGHLAGVEVAPESGEIVSIVARHHWWTRPFQVRAPELDFSVPGEIRVSTPLAS